MKKILIYLLFSTLFFNSSHAQVNEEDPVQFKYTVTKVSDNKYEVRISANIAEGWHIYSQSPSGSSIGRPTQIQFIKNPLITLQGGIKEVFHGAGSQKEDDDDPRPFYEDGVDFVQAVTLTGKVKTVLRGTIEFQACTNKSCLPPASVGFSIDINAR